ncbi:unnamed protein product [Lactuca saligna]|uniref:Uncharacterized protein n=1 Tax=Lactuca saligna TaxID=75948 RepID=A0AA35ZAL4_LACSI|nr:unnamed protein product [Lactuca saligna]
MDVEITAVLRKKPSAVPKEYPKDLEKIKLGKIYKEGWYMVFQSREQNDSDYHKACFFLDDKHMYSTSCIEHVLSMTYKFRGNSARDNKCFLDMICWYIQVRKALLNIILKVFKVQKRIKN